MYLQPQGRGLAYSHTNQRVKLLYTAFTDKVERSCHFPAAGKNCYNIGK
jgi:hypothetical protein